MSAWPNRSAFALVFLALATSSCRERARPVAEGAGAVSVAPAPTAPSAAAPTGASSLVGPSTFAVIAGVLSWSDPSLQPFSPRHRKDQELHEVLAAHGVPRSQMTLLLDADATAPAILAAVGRAADRAPPGSTLLFYYAGHGVRDAHDGEVFFASHDIVASRAAQTGLSLRSLASVLSSRFRGDRVLLTADCCFSGALSTVATALAGKGKQAVSLTSAEASNTSTSNWTFTQALIDGLSGDGVCDRDGSGTITLEELAAEVGDAMKNREGQRSGYSASGVPHDLGVAPVASPVAPRGEGPLPLGAYVLAPHEQGELVARVRQPGPRETMVRFYHYADAEDRRIENARLKPMVFRRHPVGADLSVAWGGKLWPAKVVRTDGDFHWITYPGWPAYWDEWVTSTRIADAPAAPAAGAAGAAGPRVSVEWRGTWYPAVVLERAGGLTRVHYVGYEASWDEWVPKERMRAE